MSKRKFKTNPERKTITINTKKWTRGSFCNDYGHCCAVGFLNLQTTGDACCDNPKTTFTWRSEVFTINDNLRGKERRKLLRKKFKEIGFQLRFK